ncbi:MAG: GNAT family N-acetyltransferase [Burkholderiaceae bacterium]
MLTVPARPEYLFTSRLVLEPLKIDHARESVSYWQDDLLYRYIPTNPPESVSALINRYQILDRGASSNGEERWVNWFMRERGTNKLVGLIECTIFNSNVAQLAYFVFTNHQGKGFAREGCRAALDVLASTYSVSEVRAYIDTRNTSSISLVQKLGFHCSEYIVGADFFKGETSDEYLWTLPLTAR